MLESFPAWLHEIYSQWDCNRVVMIGDLLDLHSLSFHPKIPGFNNPVEEKEKAQKQVDELYQAFPKADWILGNHDSLPYRWCESVGIPDSMMREPSKIWNVPKWNTHKRFSDLLIDGVIYRHGDKGKGGGRLAALPNAMAEFRSVVQGHHHQQGGCEYSENQSSKIFGLQVGTGIDHKAIEGQLAYAKSMAAKPVIGCGVVLGGTTAIFEPMPERYYR
jgi:hypothetical protein